VSTGNGVAVLEQAFSFGGGNLENFGLNSNTTANGFIKQLYNKQKTSVSQTPLQTHKIRNKRLGLESKAGESSDDEKPSKDAQALPPFKDLYKGSPLISMALEFGPSCIPLSAVGMILNYTGNHLLHYVAQ
jgi:hypothetical protein